MRTLNWRHTDWNARNFVFFLGQEIIGQLTFNSHWSFNAVYLDAETRLKFTQKGFWSRKVSIDKEGKKIGEIDNGFLGKQLLTLTNGERYELVSNFWLRNVTWKNANGSTIVKYRQATMASMGKGIVELTDSGKSEIEKLLVASGLFVRQLILKRAALTALIFLPILAAVRH